MKSCGKIIRYISAVACLLVAAPVWAQLDVDLDRDDWNVAEGSWSDDDNWVDAESNPSGAPALEFERWAMIDNRGTAIVDDTVDTGALNIQSGAVDIRQGGSLTVASTDFTSGTTSIGRRSNLLLSGDGAFAGEALISEGTIGLGGPDISLGLSGDLNVSGDLQLGITAGGTPKLTVEGDAVLAGTVSPTFDGVVPGLNESFEFLTGASSVSDAGLELVLPEDISLPRGVSATVATTGSTASINFQNVPILSVHRVTGAASIKNVIGTALDITGYSIFSDNELLTSEGWNSLEDQEVEGWFAASPRGDAIAELGFDATTLEVDGTPLSIGNPYNGGPTAPDDEDLRFEASLADGTVVTGFVEYEGPPNNLMLTVDPATGQAEISHRSGFIDPIDVTGYSVLSESGSLNPDGWTSFADTNLAGENWIETAPNETLALGEFNPSSLQTFSNGTAIGIGQIFNATDGVQDLRFQFATEDAVIEGSVVYGDIGGVVLPGDCNMDGVVNADDLACVTTLSDRDAVLAAINSFPGDLDGIGGVAFPDFLTLSGNFNKSPATYAEGNIDLSEDGVAFGDFLILSGNFGQGGAAAASVPEPSGMGLMSFVALLLFTRRRNRA